MAPFCIHDCFHMHWRWAEWNDVPQSLGWDGNQPFAKAGAPLVPGNQEVSLRLHSEASFTYTAKAHYAPPVQWQVFLHHGGAYALSISAKGKFGKEVALLGRDFQWDVSWAGLYWTLRYGRGTTIPTFERISWTDAQLATLREKGSGGSQAAAASGNTAPAPSAAANAGQ
jgi:hypothetical protein